MSKPRRLPSQTGSGLLVSSEWFEDDADEPNVVDAATRNVLFAGEKSAELARSGVYGRASTMVRGSTRRKVQPTYMRDENILHSPQRPRLSYRK